MGQLVTLKNMSQENGENKVVKNYVPQPLSAAWPNPYRSKHWVHLFRFSALILMLSKLQLT